MPYSAGGAVLRADLAGVVEEAFQMSETYIGTKVLPPLPVQARAGQYPTIKKDKANLLRNEVKARGPGADYPRISRAWENDNYTCAEYGMESLLPDDNVRDLSRFFDAESTEIRLNIRQLQQAHEIRTAAAIFNTGTFNLSTASTAYTAANLTTMDIGYDVDGMKQQIVGRGETTDDLTLVMSLNNFLRARQSTRLQNRIRGTISTDSQLTLTAQAMADALQVKEVLIGRAGYDTSAQGLTSTISQIWGDTYLWLGKVNAAAGPNQYFNGSTGFTIFWQQDADLFQVETYREETKRSEVIRARHYTAEKIVLSTGAQLLTTGYTA